MSRHGILRGLLTAWLVFLITGLASVSAQGSCIADQQASYERAVLQANGQVMHAGICTSACLDETADEKADAVATYERAQLQAQGQVMITLAPSPGALAAYQRAELQAQGQPMTSSIAATCAIETASG